MSESNVVYCKDCRHRGTDKCPMRFVERFDDEKWDDVAYLTHDNTVNDGFCHKGLGGVGHD